MNTEHVKRRPNKITSGRRCMWRGEQAKEEDHATFVDSFITLDYNMSRCNLVVPLSDGRRDQRLIIIRI